MAVDVCTSPRISFSHDLKELGSVPVENRNRRLDPMISNPTVDFDFDFGLGQCLPHEISSADELFADGKILPVEIKKINPPPKGSDPISPHPKPGSTPKNAVVFGNDINKKKKRLIEFLSNTLDADENDDEKPAASKPFWQFKRSISENGRANGLLQFLTRSNSTGSVPNPNKPAGFSKAIQKQHSLKEGSNRSNSSLSSSSSSLNQCYYYPYSNNNMGSKKGSLRKSMSRSYSGNNGVRVLNIPPAYIARGTVSLFGSFFCSKKSKKKR